MSERVKFFPGHEISSSALKSGQEVLVTDFEADLKYSWASGVAVSRFLNELKEGRIIARKCHKCGRIMVPPRIFCEDCFRDTDEWVYVKDTGTINTYSIAHVGTDASRLKEPLYVAVINIDGASPLMGFLHLLGEVRAPSDIKVGRKVQAVWKPSSERTGSILDIRYFRLV
ncbi:MAG TPA: Zn-ribbon domain-containing OB-fold protein [Nitrososphaerales archaeon]|nr:Zn-ribbon domain-containing OB-fold protein [Nitrososphaerales archaeon]